MTSPTDPVARAVSGSDGRPLSGSRAREPRGRRATRRHAPACLLASVAAACLALLAAGGLWTAAARAESTNASAAVGFLEKAQNKDGGFGEKVGKASQPGASLWAAVALLAAGKNPGDEWVKGGSSLAEYLAAHSSDYTSLGDLGLLAMVVSAAEGSPEYGGPVARLQAALTPAAASGEPEGGALGVLGLWAADTSASREVATAAAQALLAAPTSDGGWGREGLSTSSATALVLQALAVSGVANSSTPAATAGVEYLHKAQGNDGSIALSDRADQAIASGSVTATAFTIQALQALGLPALTTATGTTVLEGLAQYQQQTSGGLSSDGSLYGDIPPSVIETAQAFPAFDGLIFPLASVARTTAGPPKKTSSKSKVKPRSQHVSDGTAAKGVAGSAPSDEHASAFQQATVTAASKAAKAKSAAKAAAAKRAAKAKAKAAAKHTSAATPAGEGVSGEVVGAARKPRLATVAGQSGGGLSARAKATLALVAILVICLLAGAILDARRPRRDGRSTTAVTVAHGASFLGWARARGSLAPFAVALVGGALIVFPLASQMFERAPKGASMVSAFAPYMRTAKLAGYQRDVAELEETVTQGAGRGAALLSPHTSKSVARKHLAASAPQFASFATQWPATHRTLTGLLDTIQANRANYEAVRALPTFTLFPWFFVVPGAILAALALVALALARSWRALRWAAVALGVGLIAAPLAFGMWTRAPRGERMIAAFQTVETRALVTKVQNDFGQIAILDGAIGGELIPALEKRGLDAARIQRELPAVSALGTRWIAILQGLTPLLGVMSDQVANYHAVAALPAFGVFPWLFTIAGALVLALVALAAGGPRRLLARRRRRAVRPAPDAHSDPQTEAETQAA